MQRQTEAGLVDSVPNEQRELDFATETWDRKVKSISRLLCCIARYTSLSIATVPMGIPHPLIFSLMCYAAAVLVIFAGEPLAMPKKARPAHIPCRKAWRNIFARLPVIALIFAFFFAISWRPLYALGGTVSFFVIFTAISRAKFEFIREPLIFSDIALVVDVFRHKEMFYATSLNMLFWVLAFAYVFGASALFMYFEPSFLPSRHGLAWIVAMVAGAASPWLALFLPEFRRWAANLAAGVLGGRDVATNTVRFGAFTSLLYHFLIWLGASRNGPTAQLVEKRRELAARLTSGHEGRKPPVVIIWQCESFIDMRRFGVDGLSLPALDQMRERAVQWGRLGCVFEGGYTLRTEFSLIAGMKPCELGVDASYPYLRAQPYAKAAWPALLRAQGWSTHFIHPYQRDFFSRHKAMPELGFERMMMLDAFDHDPARDGPYVSDSRVGAEVVELCRREDGSSGTFIFAATMENHGPWKPGRCGELSDPMAIYLKLLERTDAAIGELVEAVDKLDRPVWLVFYGDHAPLLKSFADPFPDPRTDYCIVPLAKAARGRKTPPRDRDPWHLISDLASIHLPREPLSSEKAGRVAS